MNSNDPAEIQSVIAYYESIALHSKRMVEAARRSDWDQVVAIERDCAVLIGRLRAGADANALPERERRRKIELIRSILADDAEVRNLAQPWLADVGRFLKTTQVQRSVEQAYS